MYPNRVALSDDKGYTSIVSIARAKEIGTLQEDFSIGGGTFLIIPLTAGTIKVHFVGESGIDRKVKLPADLIVSSRIYLGFGNMWHQAEGQYQWHQ